MIDQFSDYLEIEKNYSKRTIKEYSYDLKMFSSFLRDVTLTGATTSDVRSFLAHLKREKKYQASGLVRKQATLRSFYKFCRKEKRIVENPLEFIETPRLPERKPVYLSDEERQKIFNIAHGLTYTAKGKRDYAIVSLLYFGGMRVSELVGLNIGDILRDGENVALRIIGKGDKERRTPLRIEAQEALNIWLANRPAKDESVQAIFVNIRTGKRLTARMVQLLVKKLAEKAEIMNKRITPHKFRHTFGTRLLQQGANLVDIQTLLGHASLNTTRIYTHTNPAQLRETVSKL